MGADTPRTFDAILTMADPTLPAILAPGRQAMSYKALRIQATEVASALNGFGVGRGDAVAIVLPNGPEMATIFIAIASCAIAAPLNPAYRAEEFGFFLDDLGPKLLVVMRGAKSEALGAAASRGIPVAELWIDPATPAGAFSLTLPSKPQAAAAGKPGLNGPDEDALVLHTSGTTSRPKIVPLTQQNICASAINVARTLELGPDDRCLNIMPLFHIHGLIAAVGSSLAAGASVFCTPGFDALKFFAWMQEADPTWYTAVPTMHQLILARAHRNTDIISNSRLRFSRSSSAALSAPVLRRLEETFGCPVIEAYGMTEAAHQMTSTQLPPKGRKAGSVGVAAGPDVAIMDDDGKLVAARTTGEIVIRGESVTAGYKNNPQANAANFSNGWFRTGDQGVMDAEGFVTINGRLKEIINRGGEKISPREVDDVLVEHPAVDQAVTFAVQHAKLGEDVAAVIVLKEGYNATDTEIRDFAARSLAAFKVPRRIVFVEQIPKGATGKLQRIGLAKKLGLA